jgi:hypothetical protein
MPPMAKNPIPQKNILVAVAKHFLLQGTPIKGADPRAAKAINIKPKTTQINPR